MELMENKQSQIEIDLQLDEGEIHYLLEGINRCTERLKSLIHLKAPMVIVRREIEMIQYRALGVLGMYECWALIDFVKQETKQQANSRNALSICHNGKKQSLSAWARELGMSVSGLHRRWHTHGRITK